jgi:two-component system cell cycle sensor histidine kinase/response regulator CckA
VAVWIRATPHDTGVKMQSEIEKTSSQEAEEEAGDTSILVADDDDVIRGLVTTLIEKSGYSVFEAADGSEAVDKFREHRDEIDLLVFDVRMPGKDGKQAYDEIRQIRPDIKVLFISGYGSDVLEKYGVNREDFQVISKPFMPGDLISHIKTCLSGP